MCKDENAGEIILEFLDTIEDQQEMLKSLKSTKGGRMCTCSNHKPNRHGADSDTPTEAIEGALKIASAIKQANDKSCSNS